MGVAGETVEGLYSRLEVVYARNEMPDMIFIMTGINNLAMGDHGFVPVYRKLVRGLKERYGEARIFVHSLLPVLFPWVSNDEVRAINKGLREMADDERVSYLDIHDLFLQQGGPVREYLMEDGVHVSGKGYEVWSGEIERQF